MQRRTLLQMLAAGAAWLGIAPASIAQTPGLTPADDARLRALADVVLPGELTSTARADLVAAFQRWIRNYREGAEMDHGYGFTRLRQTRTSPAGRYPAQLAALDRAARARGASFESLDAAARREIVEAAITAAKVDRLPDRPTGDHIATDLIAFYVATPEANDLAYRAAIGRDQCRGLPGSSDRPEKR
jgi:hypothetical protein